MYRKFFVYLDDGSETPLKIAIAAVSEDAARAWCEGNGDVVAVKDVTDEYPIDVLKVRKSLESGGFNAIECDFICRVLTEFQIAE